MTEPQLWSEFIKKRKQTFLDKTLKHERLIKAIMKYTPAGGRVLEVGCGSGLTSMLLSQTFYVTATDMDEEILDETENLASFHNFNLEVKKANVLALPFQEKAFHTVFSQGLLEHFLDSQIVTALKEQARVANTVIVDVPINKFKKRPFGDERLLSITHWRHLVRKSGLKIIELYGRECNRWAYFTPNIFAQKYSFIFGRKLEIVCRGR